MLRADLRIVERFCVPLSVTEIERLVKEILKPSASSSCLRCDIRSRRRVVQFSIYQNSVTRKRADQTAQILRLTSFQNFCCWMSLLDTGRFEFSGWCRFVVL